MWPAKSISNQVFRGTETLSEERDADKVPKQSVQGQGHREVKKQDQLCSFISSTSLPVSIYSSDAFGGQM